jgi:phosphoribosyl-AMP cyclohydrolase
VLFKVEQVGGAACHTGYETCFHQKVGRDGNVTIVGEKIFDPKKVYQK